MIKIAFRVNLDKSDSRSQLQRCIALASALKESNGTCDIIFLTSGTSIKIAEFPQKDLGNFSLTSWDIDATADALDEYKPDIVILDNGSINEYYLETVKSRCHLVILDDYCRLKYYKADAVVNPNVNAHTLEYPGNCELFLGTDFMPLGAEFDSFQEMKRENPQKVKHVFVRTASMTLIAVKALKLVKENFLATIIIDVLTDGESLAREIGLDGRFMVIEEVNPAKRLAGSDLAILEPTGGSFYGALMMCIPSVLLTQYEAYDKLSEYSARSGFVISLGKTTDPSMIAQSIRSIMLDRGARDRMSARMDGLVDGLGRFRLAEAILSLMNKDINSQGKIEESGFP